MAEDGSTHYVYCKNKACPAYGISRVESIDWKWFRWLSRED